MPTILQLRRGTTAENDAYTGSVGELTVDTTLNKIRLHDGSTAGGDTIGDGSGNIQIGVTGNNEIDTSSGNLTIDSAGGTVTVDDNLTVSGNLIVSGTTTTVDSTTIEVQNALVFEGSTSDDFELTLTAGDPTADRTITLPDATDTLVGKATTDTLTNKTLTSAVLNTGVSGTAILDEDNMASDSATQLATQQSIKAYVDAQVTASDLDFQGDSGGALSIDLDSETFTVAGGTAISTSGSSNTVTVTLDNTAVSAGSYGSSTAIPTFTVDAQGRLTAAGTASISSNMGIAGDSGTDTITVGTDTFTIAGGTGLTSTATTDTITLDIDSTVATLTGSQTLTNKTISLTNNTVSGTTAEFNSALSDGSFATLAGSETLTNKTISGSSNTLSNIGNSSLTNDSVTIGSTTVALGASGTDLSGLTSLDVDNITIDGNTISSTDTNGNITLDPNGSGITQVTGDLTASNIVRGYEIYSTSSNARITLGDTANSAEGFMDLYFNYYNGGLSQVISSYPTANGGWHFKNQVHGQSTTWSGTDSGGTLNTILTLAPDGDLTVARDLTVSRNATITGNLTVNGTTTTVASTNTTIADNLIELNSGAASNANDTGILIERGSTGDNAIMAWDESADKFIFGTTTATASDTGDLTIASGTIVASTFEGNLTGNATGNAGTATTLETARTIAGQSFDGSANISIASTDLSDTASIALLTSTQTLTNKTIAAGSNTISGLTSSNLTSAVQLQILDSAGSVVKSLYGSAT